MLHRHLCCAFSLECKRKPALHQGNIPSSFLPLILLKGFIGSVSQGQFPAHDKRKQGHLYSAWTRGLSNMVIGTHRDVPQLLSMILVTALIGCSSSASSRVCSLPQQMRIRGVSSLWHPIPHTWFICKLQCLWLWEQEPVWKCWMQETGCFAVDEKHEVLWKHYFRCLF